MRPLEYLILPKQTGPTLKVKAVDIAIYNAVGRMNSVMFQNAVNRLHKHRRQADKGIGQILSASDLRRYQRYV